MSDAAPALDSGFHFSGPAVASVAGFLVSRGVDIVDRVLRRAGDTHGLDWLLSTDEGVSYGEFRALLEAIGEICGDQAQVEAGSYEDTHVASPEFVQAIRETFGTIERMLTDLDQVGSGWHPLVRLKTTEVGQGDWLVEARFEPGYEPYKGFCRYLSGLLTVPTTQFGLGLGQIVEEACRCDGDDSCRFRLRWEPKDELSRRVEYLERQTQLVERRLAGLQRTVTDLVSNADLETILQRIVASARRAVAAPGYVLALADLSAATRPVHAVGLDEATSADLARQLFSGQCDDEHILAVKVESSLRTYGWLAAVDPSAARAYLPDERPMLEAYASVAAAALDVTCALDETRRQAEHSEAIGAILADERTLLSAIVDGLPHGVCWTGSDGTVAGCNQALAEQLGLGDGTILGVAWTQLVTDPQAAASLATLAEQVIESGSPTINRELTTTIDGERHVLLLSIVPLTYAFDRSTGSDERASGRLLSIWADVTEQRAMEQRLAANSRLESIGMLAAGIAHEINTPMQYIGDNSSFLDKAYGLVTPLVDDLIGLAMSLGAEPATIEQLTARAKFDVLRERIPSAATQIIEGVEAVSQIVRSLKTFAHPGGDEPEAVDLAQVLDSTVTVSRNEWKYVAEIETDIEPGLPPAMGIAGMLNQVFLNLVVNAAHAIADQREATGAAELGRITLTCHSTPEAVVTSVTDTGSGIPPGIQHKIYDQFFTTKRIGTGTGQGLAICRNIIAEHDGTISFTTSTSGTTFTVSLPLWPGEEG